MEVISSYSVEIKNMNKIFFPTLKLYNKAISYCVDVFEEEWENISKLNNKRRLSYSESLIHSTKNNIAKYDFDIKFYKMPSYMRRSVISSSIGYLSSYHSNLDNWYKSGCIGQKPSFRKKLNIFPTFYNDCMYREENNDEIKLKLYVNNDWVWVKIKLKHTDMQYIKNHYEGLKKSSPTLERKNHKWFLRFSIKENISLKNDNNIILAVDLGINTDAACCIMKKDGTILDRKFINYPSEKDQIYHLCNKIKKIQKKYGNHNTSKLWRLIKFKNEELAQKISQSIVDYGIQYNVDIIVFEYLDFKKHHIKYNAQALSLWKKNSIQKYVEHKAHKNKIRVNHINACNTSKLAFDGSGMVSRGKEGGFNNNKLCRFNNGKIYNCDLSASYNIGARYFIKQLEKTIPAKKWSDIQAKVPDAQRRSLNTYSTYLKLLELI